jgi:F420 biosynthesis protein FbiB-like protein
MNASEKMTDIALLDIMRTRRSIRRYRPDGVPGAVIAELIEAAHWAPSAHNRQPWRFAVVEATETRKMLAIAMGARLRSDLESDHAPHAVIEADVARSYARLTGAPLIIVVCLSMREMDAYPDMRRQQAERTMAIQSTAMAAQNMLLASHAYDLGACWVCAPLFVPELVREILRLPADWEAQGLLTVGYPAETRTKARKTTDKIALYLDEKE